MRRSDPIIIGAGPAGAAAAIMLARGGAKPLMLERQRETGDALCGGFLSWRTLGSLEKLGIDANTLGGHPVTRLRLYADKRVAEAPLPGGAVGLSRRAMDTALLDRAIAEGAAIEREVTVKAVEPGNRLALDHGGTLDAESLFLATGKYDLRGLGRPRVDEDPAMGIRVRLSGAALSRLVDDSIELHLFDRGYAGLEMQEDGTGNLCLAVRKSRLTEAGGNPLALLRQLGNEHPALGERIAYLASDAPCDAIAAVPYGWTTADTAPGQFRLGDQAAVIPSLAGEGNGIALASGMMAAKAWLAGGSAAAPGFQAALAKRTRRPVATAKRLWHLGEQPLPAALATRILSIAPGLAQFLASLTRIRD
jgi:menaquinone-9 beta-reductase